MTDESYPVSPYERERVRLKMLALAKELSILAGVLPPPVTPLLKRQIVDEPANASGLPQQVFLLGSRPESESKTAINHGRKFTTVRVSTQRSARSQKDAT